MTKISALVATIVVTCLVLTSCGTGKRSVQPPPTVTLQSIAVAPGSASVPVGRTQQLTATATYSDGHTQAVTATATWSTSNANVATVNGGVLTAVAQGSATISAVFSGVTGTATLTVSAPALATLVVAPTSLTQLPLGSNHQFTATGTFTDGSTHDATATVTWSSSQTAVATVSAAGMVTAVGQGTTTITAASGNVSATASVTVTAVALASISVVPGAASLALGETTQFAANGTFSDGSMQDLTHLVTWSTSNQAVASVASSGLANALATGTAVISAAYQSLSGSATLTVTREQLTAVSVGPDLPSIAAGGVQQFVLTGTFTNGATQDVTGTTWTSSDATVATIDENGLARGIKPGQVTITGAVGAISDTTTLEVTAATLQSLTITPGTAGLAKGTTQQFTATGTFSDGSTEDLTAALSWSSSVPAVASIDPSGLALAVDVGATMITATDGTLTATASLNVTAAVLTAISVTPAMPAIGIGGTVAFTATGLYSDGTSQDLTTTGIWTSSSGVIATISNTGLATAVSAGPAIITANYGGVSGSTTLTVTPATLQSITVLPASPLIAMRAKVQFSALGTFSDGTQHTVSGVAWASTRPSVASVNSSGLARSKKSGQTTITATLSGVRGAATLTVTSAALSSISINPTSAVIAAGTTQQFTATGNFADGSSADLSAAVRWQTSNYQVTTINASGLTTGVVPGTATITATFSGISASATLTVSNAVLQSLAITPMAAAIPLGGTQQFAATGTFSDGSTQVLTGVVQWSSSDAAVAVINKTGLATSAGRGSSTIAASFQSVRTTTSLQVN